MYIRQISKLASTINNQIQRRGPRIEPNRLILKISFVNISLCSNYQFDGIIVDYYSTFYESLTSTLCRGRCWGGHMYRSSRCPLQTFCSIYDLSHWNLSIKIPNLANEFGAPTYYVCHGPWHACWPVPLRPDAVVPIRGIFGHTVCGGSK